MTEKPPKADPVKVSKPTQATSEMNKLTVKDEKEDNKPEVKTSSSQLLNTIKLSPKLSKTTSTAIKRTLGGKRTSGKSKFFQHTESSSSFSQSSVKNHLSNEIPVGRNARNLPKKQFLKVPSLESETEFEKDITPPASFQKASQPSTSQKKIEKIESNSSDLEILGSPKKKSIGDEDVLDLSSLSDWTNTQGTSQKINNKENEDPDLSSLEAICQLDESINEAEESVIITGGTTPPSKKLKTHEIL